MPKASNGLQCERRACDARRSGGNPADREEMNMALHIDATGPHGGNYTYPPYFIFDDVKQTNVAGPFRWLWQARLIRWWYNLRSA